MELLPEIFIIQIWIHQLDDFFFSHILDGLNLKSRVRQIVYASWFFHQYLEESSDTAWRQFISWTYPNS